MRPEKNCNIRSWCYKFYFSAGSTGVAHDLRGGALGLCPGAGGEENSGVDKNHHDFRLLSIIFSELTVANEAYVANHYGVVIAYNNNNNNNTILGLSPQQGEDTT